MQRVWSGPVAHSPGRSGGWARGTLISSHCPCGRATDPIPPLRGLRRLGVVEAGRGPPELLRETGIEEPEIDEHVIVVRAQTQA